MIPGMTIGDVLAQNQTQTQNRFGEWKIQVNWYLIKMCGMSSMDLPDFDYRAAYTAGERPDEAAREVVAAAREDF